VNAPSWGQCHAFLLEEDAAFRDDDGYISINIALSILVDQGYSNIGVRYAVPQGHAEDALDWYFFKGLVSTDSE
jgi:hypothetical protein